MSIAKATLGGFAAGAALMYFTDPTRGKRRRAIARDKLGAGLRDLTREFDKAGRDLRNRSHGAVSAVRSLMSKDDADERVIVDRVRSVLGRAVRYPHAIHVSVQPGGRVILEGQAAAREIAELEKRVRVGGVKEVINRVEIREDAGPSGPRRRPEMPDHWPPLLRLSGAAVGAATLIAGKRIGGAFGIVGKLAGGALLARAVCNRGLPDIFGVGGTNAMEIDKSMHILAPVQEVFQFWSMFENFPRFMSHLKEVSDLGGGRSRWVAEGPAGTSVSWDAELTDYKTNECLAWRSVPGSTINSEGTVRFSPAPNGGTSVHVHMCYCPPAGVLGHGVAWLFGADPKSEMDDDLVRLKSLLEIGKTRAHGATVWREAFQ